MSDDNNNQIYRNVNKHLLELESDYFYHLYLSKSNDLKRLFGDVKVINFLFV
jgi:hypothetical protein